MRNYPEDLQSKSITAVRERPEPIESPSSTTRQRSKARQTKITTAKSAANWLRPRLNMEREELWVMALSPIQELIEAEMLFRGTVDCCLAHPRDIFRFALRMNASRILLLHNHPSGDSRPSQLDWAFTEKIIRGAWLMEIPIVDHVIVTARGYDSMMAIRPQVFRDMSRWAIGE